jgi:hypothetical protein
VAGNGFPGRACTLACMGAIKGLKLQTHVSYSNLHALLCFRGLNDSSFHVDSENALICLQLEGLKLLE